VNGLSDEVHRFLSLYIDSVEELEVLLLMRRSPERSWTAEEMARELYSHSTSITRRFQRLLGSGLLRETDPGALQYAPRAVELDRTVARVAEAYRERRVAVVSLIASKPIENVKAFSDAFRLRKRKEE
jgi:AraC-like DNA-binding protein